MNDETLARTYVRHGGSWWEVHTYDRDSSAALAPPGHRYAESHVWTWRWHPNKRLDLIYTDGGPAGTLTTHLELVKRLHESGRIEEEPNA